MYARLALVTLKSVAAARRFGRTESGQDLLEYGLLVSLIAIIAFGAVSSVGNAIHTVFWTTIAAAF
jgi:Flp pilus assembly pilin Flp